MSHIGSQRQGVATNVVAGLRGLFERSNSAGMPQVDEPRTTAARLTGNAGSFEHLVKRLLHDGVGELAISARDKEVWVGASDMLTIVEIACKRSPRCLVQREQAALVELGCSNDQAISREVLEVQRPGFRDAHTGNRE